MVDSAGVSNISSEPVGDPLTIALPQLGSLATTIHGLVQGGLSVDEAAEKIATFVDPALVPALQTLANVLGAVNNFLSKGGSAAEHGGE